MLESVFAYLLNCSCYGGLLILYTMLTRLVVRKASRKICFFLWGFVAFRLLCAWTPPFLRLPGGFMPRALPFQKALLSGPEGGRIALKATPQGDVVQVLQLPFAKERASWLMTALSLIWILGVIVFAARGILSYRRLTHALRGARLLEGGVYPVYLSGAVSSPFAMGIFNKRVYVPEGLDELQLKMAVSHEHTHLSRSDPLLKLIAYAISNIVGYSTAPMQIVTGAGIVVFLLAVVLGIQTLARYCTGHAVEGFTTVILLILLIGSVVMFSLGVIGYYIARIYEEVKGRPKYIISKRV